MQKKIIKNNNDITDNQNIFTDSCHQEVEEFKINYSSFMQETVGREGQIQAQLKAVELIVEELIQAKLLVEEARKKVELREAELREVELKAAESQEKLRREIALKKAELQQEELEVEKLQREIELKEAELRVEKLQRKEEEKKEKINKLMQVEQMADRYKNNRLKNKGYLPAKNQIVSAKAPHNRIQTQIKTQAKVVSNNLNKVTAESFKASAVSNHKKQNLQFGGRLTFDYSNKTNHNNPVTPLQNNSSFAKTTVTSVLGNHLRNHTSTTYLNRNNNLNAKNVSYMKKNPKNPKLDNNNLLKKHSQITTPKSSYQKYF